MTDDIGVGLYLEGVTERSRSSLKLCQSYRMPTGISSRSMRRSIPENRLPGTGRVLLYGQWHRAQSDRH